MTLNRVIGRKVLEEDLEVYGVVELTEDGEKSFYMGRVLTADADGFLHADTSSKISASCCSVENGDNIYQAGFHRFIEKAHAEIRKGSTGKRAIRKNIIPKGTEVVLGYEGEGLVVVSPILALPIVKQRSNNGVLQSVSKCGAKQTGSKENEICC